MTANLNDRLAQGQVILFDGATNSELYKRGIPRREGLMSSIVANVESADTVRAVHREYIEAGADVISTNTFGSARPDLAAAGLGDRFEELNRAAVAAAIDARAAANAADVAIAGCIACVSHDGSLLASYEELAHLLADAGADLIALEMISTSSHGAAATAAAKAVGLPVWAGISAVRTTDGELVSVDRPEQDIRPVVSTVAEAGVDAMIVMHSEIEDVEAMLEIIAEEFGGPVGAYPHLGTWEPPIWHSGEIEPARFAAAALGWTARGAQIVGGCCGIGPAHIAAIRETLDKPPAPPS